MQLDSLFTTYIQAGTQTSLHRVQAAAPVVPESDRQQAWHILSFALKVPTVWSTTRQLLLALATKMELAGFREEWIPYLVKGLDCAQNLDDYQTAAECELQIGLLYRLMSRFEEAHQWTATSLAHFAAQGDTTGQARALNELAWLEQLQHHYAEATGYVERAQALLRENDTELAMCYRVRGMIAIAQREWAQARDWQSQALRLFQEQGEERKVAWSMQNLGYALKELGNHEEAAHYLQQAAEVLQQLQDYYHLAIVQMNLANVLVWRAAAERARELLVAAQQTFQRHSDRFNQAHSLTNLGVVLLELQEYAEAQTNFRTAAQLYQTLGDQIWYINALDGLVLALTRSGQLTEAIQTADDALALLPTIQNSAYYTNLQQLLVKHRIEAESQQQI
ncbi:MAG: tetratricopeptide repeat protein [Caldilineaceae bacterium]|nr:tetratricopeptide repeat protein [Caldilineaceae bacterium]